MLYFFLFISLLLGMTIGSFLNCFIWRVKQKESMLNRSYCPKCRKKISWYDNIPVLSFIFLLGKCRHCRKKISWQYPIVELSLGILFAFSFFLNWDQSYLGGYFYAFDDQGLILKLIRDWFIIFIATSILVYDWKWFIIPDIIVLPAIVIIWVMNVMLGFSALGMLWLMFAGASFFLLQFLVSRGKWIGGGDVRFGAFMGVALAGLDNLILSILLSYWVGSVVGIFLVIKGKKSWTSRVPLGVFLAIGTILTLFFGKGIIEWYLSLF